MWKVLGILVLIVLPLGWGLLIEYIFERIRSRKTRAGIPEDLSEIEVGDQ